MVCDYRGLPVPVLAGRLGRSVVSLYQKARVLGLMTPGRSRTDPRLDAKVKRFSERGLSDAEVAKEIGCERHAVSDARKRLGLPAQTYSEHRREMVRRKTREQCRAAGVRNLAEVRVLAWRRRAAVSGWPADLQPRAIQILDALSARGPMTRREVAAAIGMTWRGSRNSLKSRGQGGTHLAQLMARGLVVSFPRLVKMTGQGKGRSCNLYSLALATERGMSS
jgi:hypothetical protein